MALFSFKEESIMNEENKNLEEFFDEEDNANEMNDFGRETKSWPLTVITVVILAIIALIIGGITYLSTATGLRRIKRRPSMRCIR